MIRIGAWSYVELPSEETLAQWLGEAAFAHLARNRRGMARQETLLGFALLSRMLPEADLMAIRRTEEGRPYFAGNPDVDFSVSHCRGLVICAVEVGESPRVGIDAEPIEGRSEDAMRRIAARWFSPSDLEIWKQDPAEKRFLSIWTAKEAIAKREGSGLRGLRETDRANATLAAYSIKNAVVMLACGKEKRPPEQIELFS